MRNTLVVLFLAAAAAFAQQGSLPVTIATPATVEIKRLFQDGSGNTQYICTALQKTATTYQKRSDSTLTSIAVSTNVATVTTASAHYLYPGARVTITGATVDTDLNGSYVVTASASSTTYTFTTASVADATYTDAGLIIATDFPLYNARKWAIQVLTYSGTAVSGVYWAYSNVAYNLACSDRALY